MKPRNVSRLTRIFRRSERHAVRSGWQFGRVVVGDEAADRDAGEVVKQRQHRIEHRPADIFEVNVDAVRTGGLEALGQVGLAVVEAVVEAEFLFDEAALLLRRRRCR